MTDTTTRVLRDIKAEMKRLGWSTYRTSMQLSLAGICSQSTGHRYLHSQRDCSSELAERVLDWLQACDGSIGHQEATAALKSCERAKPIEGKTVNGIPYG